VEGTSRNVNRQPPATYISAHHWSMQNLQARFSTFNASIHIWGLRMSRNYCILLFWGSCYVTAVLEKVTFSLDALSNSSPHRMCKDTKTWVPTQTWLRPITTGVCKPEAEIQLGLLMMSGIPLETCWAFNER